MPIWMLDCTSNKWSASDESGIDQSIRKDPHQWHPAPFMTCSVDALWRGHPRHKLLLSVLSRHDDRVDGMDDAIARSDISLRYIGAAYAERFTFFFYRGAL